MTSTSIQTEENSIKKHSTSTRKRGFWRGVGAGMIAKYLTLLSLIVVVYVARPFVWPILYGSPYIPDKSPLVPGTNEWYFVQVLGLLAAVASGAAAARWSKAGSGWATLAALTMVALAFSASKTPPTNSLIVWVIWFFETPLGIWLGGFLYMNHEKSV